MPYTKESMAAFAEQVWVMVAQELAEIGSPEMAGQELLHGYNLADGYGWCRFSAFVPTAFSIPEHLQRQQNGQLLGRMA